MRKLLFTEGRRRGVSLSQGQFLTYCHLGADEVCFLVHVPELKNFTTEARAQLLDVAWACAKITTTELRAAKDRRLGVGLRGALLYGGVAIGPGSGAPEKDTRSAADVEGLYPFFAAPAAPGGPARAAAGASGPPLVGAAASLASPAPAVIADVSPRRLKGPWAWAEWRRPHAWCAGPGSPPAPREKWSGGRRWQETCRVTPDAPATLTIRGAGFAVPHSRNAVFVGSHQAEVVSGDAQHLVARLAGPGMPPGPAEVAVRTSPRDPGAADRSVAGEPVIIVGPPRQVVVVEGDAQAGPVGTVLRPVVFRLLDVRGEGVPGERVWFWVRPALGDRKPPSPIRSEATTDVLGLARATITLPAAPAVVQIQAEAVNATSQEDGPFAVATATAVLATADMERLLASLRQGDPAARKAAAMTVAELGPSASVAPALPLLVEAAGSADREVRQAAVDALARHKSPEAVPLYVSALREGDMHQRMWAARGLERMGPAAKDAVPVLATVLRTHRGGEDYGPRIQALAALQAMGKEAGPAVPALLEALGDGDPWLRREAAQLLGRIGLPAARPAEAALRRIVREDPRPDVRAAAKGALEWSFGGLAPTSLALAEGDGSHGRIGTALALAARLADHEGVGLAHERVFFNVTEGAATVPASTLTDTGGLARVQLLLGPKPGPVVVEARHDRSVTVFRVHAMP